MSTRSDRDGRFELRQAAPGRYLVSVRHPRAADHETEVFDLQGGRHALRIEVGARATLSGRIGNLPPGTGSASVLILGGHGTMQTIKAKRDGAYRCEGLPPGSYLVRAFPSDARGYVDRLFGALFPLHAGAVDPKKIPPPDVTLAEGETRVLDLVLDVPPTGSVQGIVMINRRPPRDAVVILRPVPGEAPGAGGLSLRGSCDENGRFMIRDVPAGSYTLVLAGATRQELHQEPLTVAPGAIAQVQVEIAAGGLRGKVVAPDALSLAELRGYLWVLPGASAVPPDLYEHRRHHRTHRVAVRDGVFEDGALTPGPAVLVLDIRGRHRVEGRAVIPAGDTLVLDLTAGGRQP